MSSNEPTDHLAFSFGPFRLAQGNQNSTGRLSALCLFFQCALNPGVRECDLDWCGQLPLGAGRSGPAQVPYMAIVSLLFRIQSSSLSYPDLCRHFKIPSLAARQVQHDLLFLRNILSAKLDTPLLLESICLHVPTRSTRNRPLFYEPRARVNTVQRGMFCRLPRVTNSFLSGRDVTADVFSDSFSAYRGHVLRYVAGPHL